MTLLPTPKKRSSSATLVNDEDSSVTESNSLKRLFTVKRKPSADGKHSFLCAYREGIKLFQGKLFLNESDYSLMFKSPLHADIHLHAREIVEARKDKYLGINTSLAIIDTGGRLFNFASFLQRDSCLDIVLRMMKSYHVFYNKELCKCTEVVPRNESESDETAESDDPPTDTPHSKALPDSPNQGEDDSDTEKEEVQIGFCALTSRLAKIEKQITTGMHTLSKRHSAAPIRVLDKPMVETPKELTLERIPHDTRQDVKRNSSKLQKPLQVTAEKEVKPLKMAAIDDNSDQPVKPIEIQGFHSQWMLITATLFLSANLVILGVSFALQQQLKNVDRFIADINKQYD